MSECKINIYNTNLSDENVIIALFDGKRESRFRYFKDYKVYSIPANGWRIFGMIDAYVEVVSKLIKTLKNPKKILFIGICKHSNMVLECVKKQISKNIKSDKYFHTFDIF